MLHHTIADRYVRERNTYGRLLRLAFSMAGIFWIVIYALPLETHMVLRSGQTFIYFVLLTLWGLDYMREQRRLTLIIQKANTMGVTPKAVTIDDVSTRAGMFTMITPRGSRAGLIMPLVFVIGMVAAWCLIGGQYVRAISLFMQ